jgi:folate-dependent tRNA-U54 methylase TrmFO/GidA
MNANFGLLEELPDPPRDKVLKRERYAERSLRELGAWRQEYGITAPEISPVHGG